MIGKDAEWGDFPNVVPALNAEVTSHPRLEHTRALCHTPSAQAGSACGTAKLQTVL